MTRNGSGTGVRGFVRVALLLAAIAVLAIFLGCEQPPGPVVEPPPTEPPPVDHDHLASGAAFQAFLRDGTEDALTARAVDAVLAAIPADEQPAFVAELGEIDLRGSMSELMTNVAFRRLLRITGPLYDAEYGSEQRRLQSSSAAAGALADKHDDPPDPLDDLRKRLVAYLQSWVDWAEEKWYRVMDRVFGKTQGTISVLSACNPIQIIKSRLRCALAIATYIGWNIQTTDPPKSDPGLEDKLPPNRGERFNYVADRVVPCEGGRCEWYTPPDHGPPSLTFPVSRLPDQTYVVGRTIEPVVFPEATGGVPPVTYRCRILVGVGKVPGLGLQFHGRTLSGTPSQEGTGLPSCDARDAEDGLAELGFTFTVTAAPLEFVGSMADQTYVVGTPVRITLPEARGGTPPLKPRIFSSPPSPWLGWNSAALLLSGTPTEAGEYRLRYEVTDANGQQIELRFTVTVTERTDPPPEPPEPPEPEDRNQIVVAYQWLVELRQEPSKECTQRAWATANGAQSTDIVDRAQRKCEEMAGGKRCTTLSTGSTYGPDRGERERCIAFASATSWGPFPSSNALCTYGVAAEGTIDAARDWAIKRCEAGAIDKKSLGCSVLFAECAW